MYRSHLGPVDGEFVGCAATSIFVVAVPVILITHWPFVPYSGLAVSTDGTLCLSWSRDRTAKAGHLFRMENS